MSQQCIRTNGLLVAFQTIADCGRQPSTRFQVWKDTTQVHPANFNQLAGERSVEVMATCSYVTYLLSAGAYFP